jgi:hypothetical protein
MDWLPAQRAPLALPSGRLHVEGYNNLRLDPDDSANDKPDDIVIVPPNDYVVSLYRRPLDHADETHPRRANVQRPRHLIILTESGSTAPVEGVQPMLRAGAPPTAVLDDEVGRYRIRDGAFFGLGKVTS